MNLVDAYNIPLEFSLGNLRLKVCRIASDEWLGNAMNIVLQNYNDNRDSIATHLTGKEKIDYYVEMGKNPPSKQKIYDDAMSWILSGEGVTYIFMVGLNKHQQVTKDEIVDAMKKSTAEQMNAIFAHLVGIDPAALNQASEEVKNAPEKTDAPPTDKKK